jgi:hypothetical protein
MPNPTLNYLLANSPLSTMAFAGAVTTTSAYLNGPGGLTDGYPLTRRGLITRLRVWDGTTLRSENDEIAFADGDRLAVYCQHITTNFTVKIRLNGTSTEFEIANVPQNVSLFVVVEFVLIR